MPRFPRSGSLAALVVGVSLLLYGCGDPGWSVVVRNDTDHSVFVRLQNGNYTVAYLPAGAEGYLSGGLGIGHRGLEVLTLDCTAQASIDTGDQGTFDVAIAADGSATVRPGAPDGVEVGTMDDVGGICGGYASCIWTGFGAPKGPMPSDLDVLYDRGCPD